MLKTLSDGENWVQLGGMLGETHIFSDTSKKNDPGQISVNAYKQCWTTVISEAEAKQGQWGWWSVWHEKKKQGNYFKTPHLFKNIKPGNYTLVVYDPQSINYDPNSGESR